MSASHTSKSIPWWRLLFAVCCTAVLILTCWQAIGGWRLWKQFTHDPSFEAEMRARTLAWKQPILPAQFEQGSCGSCHRDDLPQTPRLNHGRQLIVKYNCVGCHVLQDFERPEMLGPDLTNVGTKVSRAWIYKWLKEPRTLLDADGNVTVNGVALDPRMPKFQLSEKELLALSAYLSVQGVTPGHAYRRASVNAISAASDEVVERGHTRFNQLFCVTCHALAVDRGGETKLIGGDIGPELTKVGSKVKPEWLMAWLRNPKGYLQHTKMPQFQWSDKDLGEVAQYMLTKLTDPDLLKDVPQMGPPTDAEISLGGRLFVKKGCVQCHIIEGTARQDDFGPNLTALGMAAGHYLVEIKSAKKLQGRLHFVKGDVERLEVSESLVPRAMIAYVQAKITNSASVTPETNMPQFHMSQSDLDDLTTALLSMSGPSAASATQRSLVVRRSSVSFRPDGLAGELYDRYKCYVCHSFRGYGGTLAPDLTFEGSRSKHDWLIHFLMNPQTLRPTLTVRMPHFNISEREATTLADYLSNSLREPHVNPAAISDNEFTAEMAERGKRLFEETYKCQSCHTIGSSGGYVGPALNNAGNWLTAAWIGAWLRNPQALVPGVIEPRHSFAADEIRDITAYLLTLKEAPAANNVASAGAGGGPQ